jgi:integrase
MTLLYTGLRVSELVALTRSDIALSERKGTITIRAEIAKGGKERLVPIPKDAREALALYIWRCYNGGEVCGMGKAGWGNPARPAPHLRLQLPRSQSE